MNLRWPKYDADKPIQSCCFVSLAYSGVVLLALIGATVALIRPDLGRHEAGISLLAVFTIGPIMLAGLPWSVMIIDTHLPDMLQYVLVAAGVLMNALLIGFAIGLVRAVRRTG
jgi:hypothetical protein